MRVLPWLALTGLVAVSPCLAVVSIDVGTHTVPSGGVHSINLVAGGDDLVTGFNLRAQIGDSSFPGAQPAFVEIRYPAASVWAAFPASPSGGPLAVPQYAQSSILLDNAGEFVLASGLIAILDISTDGVAPGTYALKLSLTDIGQDSAFVLGGGTELVPVIVNGSIVVIPEPAAAALLGLPALGLFRRRRR